MESKQSQAQADCTLYTLVQLLWYAFVAAATRHVVMTPPIQVEVKVRVAIRGRRVVARLGNVVGWQAASQAAYPAAPAGSVGTTTEQRHASQATSMWVTRAEECLLQSMARNDGAYLLLNLCQCSCPHVLPHPNCRTLWMMQAGRHRTGSFGSCVCQTRGRKTQVLGRTCASCLQCPAGSNAKIITVLCLVENPHSLTLTICMSAIPFLTCRFQPGSPTESLGTCTRNVMLLVLLWGAGRPTIRKDNSQGGQRQTL